jgi:glycosyltransferase involved in cell wall biosynthesis
VKAKTKKILFFNCGAELYGADYVLLQLIRHLDGSRFEPIVVLPYDGPLAQELRALQVTCLLREIPVLRRASLSFFGIWRFAGQTLAALIFALRLCRREKVDIIHTNTAAIWIGGLAAALLRRPHVWQIMELVGRPRIVAWWMNAMVALFSTQVFCISNAVRDHFTKDWPRRQAKYETLYHGVDLSDYSPESVTGTAVRERLGLEPGTVLVLYASRFSAWKGQDVLAEAARQIVERKSVATPLHFAFLGSCYRGQENFETALREQLTKVPQGERTVSVHGFQKNLPEWMAAADMLVLPSKLPEPNATVVLAGMAMKLPVIGTAIGGTVETIVPRVTGLLVPPDDPEALARAIVELAADAPRRQAMGLSGRERVEQVFSLERYCQRIIAQYDT